MRKIFIILLLLISCPAFGATYYVATTGDDNADGSIGTPWKKIQKCANTIAAGNTCSVAAGNYGEDVNIPVKTATEEAHRRTFISTGGQAKVKSFIVYASYITIDNFEITGGTTPAIRLGRYAVGTPMSYLTVQNCYFHDNADYKWVMTQEQTENPTHITFKDNIVKPQQGYGFRMMGSYWLIEGNLLEGIRSDIFRPTGDHHTIQDNTILLSSLGRDPQHPDIIQHLGGVSDFMFQRNKIMYGTSLQIGNYNNTSACTATDHIYRNNVFYHVSNPLNFAGCNTVFHNNTFVFAATAPDSGIVVFNQYTDTIDFQNNLFVAFTSEANTSKPSPYWATFSNLTSNNNMAADWPSRSYAAITGFNSANGNINGGDPKFTNIPISVYGVEEPAMTCSDVECVTLSDITGSWPAGSIDPVTGLDGNVFLSANCLDRWTWGSGWTRHTGLSWLDYYAEHSDGGGTATLQYDYWQPIPGRTYTVLITTGVPGMTSGSITVTMGGKTVGTCGPADLNMDGNCPRWFTVPDTDAKFVITPTNDFEGGIFKVFVTRYATTAEYSFGYAPYVHGGAKSAHLAQQRTGDTVKHSAYPTVMRDAFLKAGVWVYLVSGSVEVVRQTGVNESELGTLDTLSTWTKFEESSYTSTYGVTGDYILVRALEDDTEYYVDDFYSEILHVTTSTLQYDKLQEAALTVGSNIAVNGDGVCREITVKDTETRKITFTPALSSAPTTTYWIEAWGSSANCVVDLTLQSDSPAKGTGANLSAIFTDDINKTVRQSAPTAWDMGAYMYGGSDVTAPTAFASAVASDGETLTITWSETVVATASTGFTITPSGGAATLSHVSTSGNTSTFTISRIILYGETAVIGYTQPGDGIEDPTGNDVVTFSGFSVTNNSTQIDSPERTLTVTMTGGGRATSSPAGIDCGATCVYDFSNGATVTLSGQCHNGWQNATITGDCNAGGAVVMSADSACTVTCYEIPVSPWVQ